MEIFYPLYYKDFSCIADKCRHSCCVGWEIILDRETEELYDRLGREDILRHVDNGEIALLPDRRCPFLDEGGLCRIICELGEDLTSRICREHPRFYHRVGERIEGGIGLCCEEACRIALSSDAYAEFIVRDRQVEIAEETDFDSLTVRGDIYGILSDGGCTYAEKLDRIASRYGVDKISLNSLDFSEEISSLEYLYEEHRELFLSGKGRKVGLNSKYFERFFAYLIFRHLSVASCREEVASRVGFCLLLLSLLENLCKEDSSFEQICDIARIISEELEYSEENTSMLMLEIQLRLSY